MKYKFVYDADFIAKNNLCLSEEEVRIVLATVLGQHNAIFWGYKPERLAKAVSCLSDNGILILNDIGLDKQQYLMNNFDKDKQYMLVESTPPSSTIICGLIEKFSVVYKCVEAETCDFTASSKSVLRNRIEQCNFTRRRWDSTGYIQGKLPTLQRFWVTDNFWNLYIDSKTLDGFKAIKFAAVARSLSDVDKICVAQTKHFEEAKKYYNTGITWNEDDYEEQNYEIQIHL